NAVDVCAFNDIVVVADSERGISVFNVFNRMAPLIIAQVDTPGTAQRVSCSGNLIAVADGAAGLAVVDITDPPAAHIRQQEVVGGFDGGLQDLASVASPYISTPNRRLFVGGGIAYAVHGKGCNTFNLTNGVQPVLIAAGSTTQFGWKQLIPNGSGLAVGAVDNNFALDGPNDVSLYNVSDPANVNRFLTTFQTPGTSE